MLSQNAQLYKRRDFIMIFFTHTFKNILFVFLSTKLQIWRPNCNFKTLILKVQQRQTVPNLLNTLWILSFLVLCSCRCLWFGVISNRLILQGQILFIPNHGGNMLGQLLSIHLVFYHKLSLHFQFLPPLSFLSTLLVVCICYDNYYFTCRNLLIYYC